MFNDSCSDPLDTTVMDRVRVLKVNEIVGEEAPPCVQCSNEESEKDESSNNKNDALTDSMREQFIASVSRGAVDDVIALFAYLKEGAKLFDANSSTAAGRYAMRIAIENHDIDMCRVLLGNQVDDGDCIFDAIQFDFVEGVKLIVAHFSKIDPRLKNFVKTIGNPDITASACEMAACRSNYDVLSILYKHDHKLPETLRIKLNRVDRFSWEASVMKQIYYKAMTSPSYITVVCEEGSLDPFDHCINLIQQTRHNTILDDEQKAYYRVLINQVEDYMCALLDEVNSTTELRQIFNWFAPKTRRFQNKEHVPYKFYKENQKSQLSLLEKACDAGLVKFVTHQKCQFILTSLLNQNTLILRGRSRLTTSLMSHCLGLFYFIWPLLCLFPPSSKLGALRMSPTVMFECHLMSEISFLALLIAYTVSNKNPEQEYLGSPPTFLQWLILLWIIGKWIVEFREYRNRGVKTYLKDLGNYFDLIYLIFFTVAILARALDLFVNFKTSGRVYREDWRSSDPRMVSVAFFALAYILAFMKILSFFRTDRLLGPITLSLSKMMLNVLLFFVVFSVLMFAFGVSLSELYWYFGTERGKNALCAIRSNSTDVPCTGVVFSSIENSLKALFWALFGYLDLNDVLDDGQNTYLEEMGVFFLGIFHITVIFVMLNMLIAMMTKSFDETVENKETEWKFSRTKLWIRFIRDDYSHPPPMNLFPNIYAFFSWIKSSSNCCSRSHRIDFTDWKKENEAKRIKTALSLVQRFKTKYIIKKEPVKTEDILMDLLK